MDAGARHARGRLWLSLTVGGLLAACLLLGGYGLFAAQRARLLRCYTLVEPFTPYEQIIMSGRPIDCLYQQCRATIRLTAGRGLACFFPRTWPASQLPLPARPAAASAEGAGSPTALQKSFFPWEYRTA